MKTLSAIALVACLGIFANAQESAAPAQATQEIAATVQAVQAPAAVQTAPEKTVTIEELRKNQVDTAAELKKKQIDEIRALKDSLKGKPAKEIKKAVEMKKAEQRTAMKTLRNASKAEIMKFKKDHPKPRNKNKKHEASATK